MHMEIVLLCAGIAYFILTKALIAQHGQESKIAKSIGKDWKELGVHFSCIRSRWQLPSCSRPLPAQAICTAS